MGQTYTCGTALALLRRKSFLSTGFAKVTSTCDPSMDVPADIQENINLRQTLVIHAK